jgi:uncharacterized protein with ATP-grasp and redox domains
MECKDCSIVSLVMNQNKCTRCKDEQIQQLERALRLMARAYLYQTIGFGYEESDVDNLMTEYLSKAKEGER